MKKLMFTLLPVIVLTIACKKNSHVNTDEVRLQSQKTTDSSGKISSIDFQYDQQGRIISCSSTDANGKVFDEATVSYSGNEITITFKPGQSATLYNSTVVWYKLNTNNVPDRRIQTDILNVNDPSTSTIQKTTQADTTDYIYDAAGLLTKATGSYFDTTWYNDYTGYPLIETNRAAYTRNYTNSNNMMTQLVINRVESYKSSRGGITSTGTTYTDDNYAFEYNRKYPNKSDFNNAVVLGEFGVIFTKDYLLNKSYAYIPDKISYTENVRYSSGVPGSTSNSNTVNLAWGYNKYGFISSLTDNYKHDFIYNY